APRPAARAARSGPAAPWPRHPSCATGPGIDGHLQVDRPAGCGLSGAARRLSDRPRKTGTLPLLRRLFAQRALAGRGAARRASERAHFPRTARPQAFPARALVRRGRRRHPVQFALLRAFRPRVLRLQLRGRVAVPGAVFATAPYRRQEGQRHDPGVAPESRHPRCAAAKDPGAVRLPACRAQSVRQHRVAGTTRPYRPGIVGPRLLRQRRRDRPTQAALSGWRHRRLSGRSRGRSEGGPYRAAAPARLRGGRRPLSGRPREDCLQGGEAAPGRHGLGPCPEAVDRRAPRPVQLFPSLRCRLVAMPGPLPADTTGTRAAPGHVAILLSASQVASRERIFLATAELLAHRGYRVTLLAARPNAELRARVQPPLLLRDIDPIGALPRLRHLPPVVP